MSTWSRSRHEVVVVGGRVAGSAHKHRAGVDFLVVPRRYVLDTNRV